MKNIVLVAPPFSGHLHPILGIAQELSKIDGFNITVISTKSVKDKVLSLKNVQFYSILDNFEKQIEDIANPEHFVKSNPIKLLKQLKQNILVLKHAKQELKKVIKLVNPECVIADFTITVAGLICEELNIKWFTTLPSPCVYEYLDGTPAYLGGLKPSNSPLVKAKYKAYSHFIRTSKKIFFKFFEKDLREIGFTSLYRKDGSEVIYSNQKIFALGLKELEFNNPKVDCFEYVGPVLFTPEGKEEETNLFSFYSFSKSKKNILVTFGTHLKFFKKEVIEYFTNFCKENKQYNVHISLGDDKNHLVQKIHDNLMLYSFVPYNKYLKNYDIVVHHGGSGIMYECIKHGKISIVFPQDYDQFDNAARIENANLGIRIKSFKEVNLALHKIEITGYYKSFITFYQNIVVSSDPISKIVAAIESPQDYLFKSQ